jgi:CPA2 family monovalent cation:H+ antiporter-2
VLHAAGLKGLIIFLIVAGIVVPLFHRARIGTVLGFLIGGAALGPHGLGRLVGDYPFLHYVTFDNPAQGEVLAEFGIVILLFLLGLELSLQRLWQLRRYVLGVGLAQVVLSTLLIAVAVRLAGAQPPAGLVLGMCLALSSTAIVMQLLTEQNRAAQPVGRIALSVLLFQDLMVVPVLFVVGLLGGGEAALSGGVLSLIPAFAGALAAVLAILLAGRFLVRPLLHQTVRTGSRDLIMALSLLILVAASLATALAGLSAALGAFLAGMLLSDSESRHQIEIDLEPFKGLLLGIFFITVGSTLDVLALGRDLGWIALAVVLLMGAKAAVLYLAARGFGVPRATAAELALLLGQAGEFAFVVIGTAAAEKLLSPRLASASIAVVALSMMATPVAALLGRRAAARLEPVDHGGHAPGAGAGELKDHVVIGGCGRVGQMIAETLEAERIRYICLDTNIDAILHMRQLGRPAYYGDASREELLEKVGGAQARAFVVTLTQGRGPERMVSAARRVNRAAFIFARARDHRHAARLVKLGALGVIPETVEASLQLAGRLLEGLDVPDEAIAQRIDALRDAEIARLDEAEMAG